jgi:hypothetical protein
MRRTLIILTLACIAALALTGVATAAPKVTVKGRAVAIPGYKGTGNILGAGAAVQVEVKISGTEYGGFPPPLIGVNAYLPTGVHLNPQGFKTCPTATIFEEKAPENCPKGSAAGPVGKVDGVVAFGTTRVHESAELFSFFAPHGGLEFFTFGHSPTTLEVPSSGHYVNLNGGGGFGPKFIAQVPLVTTVPNAPYASVEAINVKIGAARRDPKTHKPIFYGRVPKKCPTGGFKVKAELTFAENGELAKPVTVVVPFRAPCPPKKK